MRKRDNNVERVREQTQWVLPDHYNDFSHLAFSTVIEFVGQ